MNREIAVFDSTLRDGAQGESISFSVSDKLKIVEILDALGVKYIEAGNPGSNPKDLEFFGRVAGLRLKNARLAAFGSTRRSGKTAAEDENVRSMLLADTPVAVIFGKAWDFHVTKVLKTTLEENLNMIRDTIAFFKKEGRETIFDAEHFFDGARANEDYAFQTLRAAAEGGADALVLCDTNGGSFPSEIFDRTKKAAGLFSVPIGIHCHNDDGMAVANSVMAVEAGASHVQGTLTGIGERCGNANLSSLIPTLQLKRDYACIPGECLPQLTQAARLVAELSNMPLPSSMPYVGLSAFAHKGGMHIDGVLKDTRSFEHVAPESIGNERRFLMSEVSGRSTILAKIRKICPDLDKESPEAREIIDLLKDMEHKGYQYEGAEPSFELLVRRHLGKYKPFFELEKSTIIADQAARNGGPSSSATVIVNVEGERRIAAAEGDGPVNALDCALRRALETFYPELGRVHLTDYKVRVLNPEQATAARVRVWIESTDGTDAWTTVGVSTDILEASGRALTDAIEYKLLKTIERKFKPFI
ncbi:MAG: citramalate synthase [Candidatus Aminicenantales bacterium]